MRPVEASIDHLVIVTSLLEDGVDFCEKTFGVALQKGGEHVRVGTHNCVLNLGEGIYLEVIAVNPNAGKTDCPRWFGMDRDDQRKRAENGPYLATFVARTSNIERVVAAAPELGPIRDMHRGTLLWQITIPDDGALVEEGTVPTVIQWPRGVHPTQNMPESGCRLLSLEAFHPAPPELESIWSRIGLKQDARLAIRQSKSTEPYLVAQLATPNGIITLR